MADHNWVQDHIASYLAGGLDAAERTELEAHVASCGECRQAVDEARRLDRQLTELFVAIRPTPDLEDRTIRHLRLQGIRRPASPLRQGMIRVLLAAAAVLLLGLVGAGMSMLADESQGSVAFFFADDLGQDGERLSEGQRVADEAAQAGSQRLLNGALPPPVAEDPPDSRMHAQISGERFESVWDLAAKARTRNLALGDGRNLENDEIGIVFSDHRSRSGVTVDRLEEEIRKEAGTFWAEKSAGQPAMPQGGAGRASNAGPGNVDSTRLHFFQNEGHSLGRAAPAGLLPGALAPPLSSGGAGATAPRTEGGEANGRKLSEAATYYSYRDNKPDGEKQKESGYLPGGKIATVRPGTRPAAPATAAAVDAPRTPPPPQQAAPPTPTAPAEADNDAKQPADQAAKQPKAEPEAKLAPEAAERKIIRTGEMEFEVDNFDSAVERVEKIAAEEGGLIATVNSDKLPNGKMKGNVVLRVPPKNLDDLIKKLRALGELKRQRLGSQDVTKLYYDIDSRLKAARVMEKRLLEIIAKGNGQVKDLVEAEKELGVWRTRIEELEGEVRYYNNLVSLATLTVILTEKDIRSAYAVVEHRRVDLGIEVEDVEAAQRKAHELINQAKGRVTRSELRKGEAGSFQAVLQFETTPEEAGPLVDALKQIGTVTRQEMDQSQQTEGGVKRPLDVKVTRANVDFQLSLYNLATLAAEQSVHVSLAVPDVEEAYKKVLARAEKSAVRMLASNLDQSRPDQATANLIFEVKTADADGILALIKQAGEVMRLQEVETQGAQITKAKRGFKIEFHALASVKPREIISQNVVTANVPKSYQALQEAVATAKGRILDARLDEQDGQNVTAQLHFDISRAEEGKIQAVLNAIGASFGRTVSRDTQTENTLASKVGYRIALYNQAGMKPRETIILGIEVPEVEKLAAHLTTRVVESQGRTIHSSVTRERSGLVTARLVYHVPLAALQRLAEEFKQEGHVAVQDAIRNPEVPENELAIGRLEVTLSYRPIVEAGSGFWDSIRRGLEKSLAVLGFSLSMVVVGLCTVLPAALVGYGFYRFATRGRRENPPAPATSSNP